MIENVDQYKQKLLEEKKQLEHELSQIAQQNPDNPDDWEATPADPAQTTADKNEVADRLEDFEQTRSATVDFETRLNNVKRALEKIEEGTYGICDKSGKEIPKERLDANAAATTLAEFAS